MSCYILPKYLSQDKKEHHILTPRTKGLRKNIGETLQSTNEIIFIMKFNDQA